MAQTQRAHGPSESGSSGGGMADSTEQFGNGGLVGDGRYRLTGRLGRGGMAEVFAAEDVRLGRTVAVKLLRADLAEDPVSKARFTREAQSVAGLNHHAVVAVYDSGEDVVAGNTVPYIVMELVEGRTIRDLLINADAPPPDQALIIVSGVLEALAYSHHHGIVHRDIKPANVIITNTGAVKVMDFGIARALHGAASTMTQTGMVMGTPQYLSPEQALGKTVDTRSDLYATGCLLYELLAMRPPFTGETPLSVVYQHVQDIPVPPSQVYDGVPPELDGLVMRSLAKDPDDRFQTAEEMRGMVQYAVQRLAEVGGHTGVWDTGPAVHTGGVTPAMGMGMAGAGAMQHPDSGTAPQALGATAGGSLLGGPREDDGGFTGDPGPGERSGRGKMWAFVALAVIAVVMGVAFAVTSFQDDTGKPGNNSSTTAPQKSTKPSKTSEDRTTEGTLPGNSDGGQESFAPSDTPSASESQSPSQEPSSEAPTETSDEPTPSDSGGNSDGGSSGSSDPTPSQEESGVTGGTLQGNEGSTP